MSEAIQKREPAPVAEVSPAAIIAQMAADPNCDADKLQKLLDIRDQWEAGEARKAYAADMAKCQEALRPVVRDAFNNQTSSKYPKYESIQAKCKPTWTAHGFSLSFSQGAQRESDGFSEYACICTHRDGHQERFNVWFPQDSKGIKGNVNKTPIHGAKSAVTYAKGTLVGMVFDLAFVDRDDDGNAAGAQTVTPEQAKALKTAAQAVDHEKQTLEFFKVAKFEDLPAEQYAVVMAGLKKRAAK